MIAALARAAAVFEAPEMLAARTAAFDFLDAEAARRAGAAGPRLARGPHRRGRDCSTIPPAFARAALALFEATGEPRYLKLAEQEARAALSRFGAPDGGLYLTAADAEDAPAARARIAHDGATPSGVGLMAEVLVRLYHLTDDGEWREAAERLIGAFAGGDPREVTQSPLLLAAWDFLQRGGCVAVEGDPADPALRRARRRGARAPPIRRSRCCRSTAPRGPTGVPAAGRRRRRPRRRCCVAARFAACRSAIPRRCRRR